MCGTTAACFSAVLTSLQVSLDTYAAQSHVLAREAFDDQCTVSNPRYPLIGELRSLIMRMYGPSTAVNK